MIPIYLTLTTRPERVISDHFRKVFNSLKNQTLPFDKLILNLSIKEFSYTIPEYLLQDSSVIVNETDICGPCTKLIGSIDIIPEDTMVIVLDDDIVMKSNFVKSMYDSYIANPECVSSHFITVHSSFIEVAGFGGYVFHCKKLKSIKQFYLTMPSICKYIDDTWLSWCIKQLGVNVVETIEKNAWFNVLDIANTDPHPEWHELYKDTDRIKLIEDALKILI